MAVRGNPTLMWNPASYAEKYRLRYFSDAGLTDLIYESPDLTSTAYTPEDLTPGIIYWQVSAGDAAGNWGPWSPPRSLIILPEIPAAPTPTSPSDGATINNSELTLEWSAVPEAVAYHIQIDDSPGFSSPLIDTTTGVPSYLAALSDGVYYWRIQAINSRGEMGPWSFVWSFAVSIPPTPTPTDTPEP
jgi:hypothetical protein